MRASLICFAASVLEHGRGSWWSRASSHCRSFSHTELFYRFSPLGYVSLPFPSLIVGRLYYASYLP